MRGARHPLLFARVKTSPPSASDWAARLAFGSSLLWLWFQLINHLRIEWSVNAQYAYGWAVPLLGLYLVARKVRGRAFEQTQVQRPPVAGDFSEAEVSGLRFPLLLLGAAVLYAPTRLIQEANPDWRLVSWALALEVIAITLGVFSLFRNPAGQNFRLSALVFPLGFFLVAVPWPSQVESVVIQNLTRANAAVTIELLNSAGVPALQRGNVIEISTGLVGIDDACSGIRSFQAALMLALFLGECYGLTWWRRGIFVLSGFALAFGFNVARTVLLVAVAVRQGVPAIARWHDPAGVTILVGCFLGLWGLGLWLAKRQNTKRKVETLKTEIKLPTETAPSAATLSDVRGFVLPRLRVPAFSLVAWLLIVEVGTELWYRTHEGQLPAASAWQPVGTAAEADHKELPISENARRILRYDAGRNVAWTQPDGSRWQMIFLQWNGGRIAAHLARNHTPEVCLSAAGHELQSVSDVKLFNVAGLALPFRLYTFQNEGTPLFVFYCLREDRARADRFTTESLTFDSRLAAVWAGRRNLGQRSLEIAIWGQPDAAAAETALQHELEKMITVKN